MAQNLLTRDLGTLPGMQARFRRVARQLPCNAADLKSHRAWRRKVGARLKSLTGYDTMVRCEARPKVTDVVDCGDYIRQRVEICTEPQVIMPMFVLIPKQGSPPYPVVIAPHGHGSGGKLSPAGCSEVPAVAAAIREYNYAYGVAFAKNGFITFCPDARGFGERREEHDRQDIMRSSCLWLNQMAYPLGQTVTGMWMWDIHRLIDYIEKRDDCDSKRLGCAGLSGGGLQTLWATALDNRVKCAIVSGYLYGYKESLLDLHTNCSCNYVPHLYEHVDMGDIAAMIAPRPLLVETGDADTLNGASGVKNVKSQVRIARRAYKLFGATRLLKHHVFEGAHRWDGAHAVPWLRKHLK